jgi:hypothetical protein
VAASPIPITVPSSGCPISILAIAEATIKAYIESQKWDEDDQGFKITAPTEP